MAHVYNDDAEPDVVTTLVYLRSTVISTLNRSEMDPNLAEAKIKILKRLEDYTYTGSGWRLTTMLYNFRPGH